MSVTGLFLDLPSQILEVVKKAPPLIQLLYRVTPVSDNLPTINNLQGLPSEKFELLRAISDNTEQIAGKWTLWDLEALETWKESHPKLFTRFQSNLYSIVDAGKTVSCLEVGSDWGVVSYIFTGSALEKLPFLVNESAGSLRVNCMLCGQPFDENYGDLYLEPHEVEQIATGLSKFSDDLIRERFEQGLREQPNTYPHSFFWVEESYNDAKDLCDMVKHFYSEAAHNGKAVLISVE